LFSHLGFDISVFGRPNSTWFAVLSRIFLAPLIHHLVPMGWIKIKMVKIHNRYAESRKSE